MAKLYWRVKKDGKWTFRAAKMSSRIVDPTAHLETVWGYFVQEESQ